MLHGGPPVTATPLELESAKRDVLFQRAKHQFALANIIRLIAVAMAIGCPIVWPTFGYLPLALLLLTFLAEWLNYASDTTRSNAERVARTVDFLDGLDWQVDDRQRLASSALVRDAAISEALEARRRRGTPFFDSATVASPLRTVENTRQSSWYTMQLAGSMRILMWFLVGVGLTVAVIYYFAALNPVLRAPAANAVEAHAAVLKTTSALITAILSLGLIRLAVAYGKAADGAKQIFDAADAMMKQRPLKEQQAAILLSNYHMIRAGMPLIPDFIWKVKEGELNTTWQREIIRGSRP